MTTNLNITATSADELDDITHALGGVYGSLSPHCEDVAGSLWAAGPANIEAIVADWIGRFEPLHGCGSEISDVTVDGVTISTPTSGTLITFRTEMDTFHVSIDYCRNSYYAARDLLALLPEDMLVDNGDLPQGWQHRISAAEAIAALDEDRKEAEDIVAMMRSIAPAHWNFYVDGTTVSGGHSVRQYR